jgi:hypothetical protein
MINVAKIQDSLIGLIGFKQPFNPDYAIVDSSNQLSKSGYFVTDNPYAKIEYIKDTQDYVSISDIDFNKVLKQIKQSSISNVCNQVFSDYDFLDRNLLFKNATKKVNTNVLPIGFVGYRIEVGNTKNIAFKLNRVLLDFEGTGTIKLLLWNTASLVPLFSKEITIGSDHQSEVLDWVLDNSNNTYKGDYYIGYNTDGLTVMPYARDYENGNVMSSFKYLNIEQISVANHNTEVLFDISTYDGLSEDPGLNFDISVFDDYTDFVINNAYLFARAIQLDCQIQCIQLYLASLRSNLNQAMSAQLYEKIMIELEGTSEGSMIRVKGLKNQLIGEITSIRNEIQKIKIGVKKAGQILVSTLE